jgi:hypothetical protein
MWGQTWQAVDAQKVGAPPKAAVKKAAWLYCRQVVFAACFLLCSQASRGNPSRLLF